MDRNLYRGEEIKHVYEEIMQTVEDEHLIYDKVSYSFTHITPMHACTRVRARAHTHTHHLPCMYYLPN